MLKHANRFVLQPFYKNTCTYFLISSVARPRLEVKSVVTTPDSDPPVNDMLLILLPPPGIKRATNKTSSLVSEAIALGLTPKFLTRVGDVPGVEKSNLQTESVSSVKNAKSPPPEVARKTGWSMAVRGVMVPSLCRKYALGEGVQSPINSDLPSQVGKAVKTQDRYLYRESKKVTQIRHL